MIRAERLEKLIECQSVPYDKDTWVDRAASPVYPVFVTIVAGVGGVG